MTALVTVPDQDRSQPGRRPGLQALGIHLATVVTLPKCHSVEQDSEAVSFS